MNVSELEAGAPLNLMFIVCTLKNTQSSNLSIGEVPAPAIAPGPASRYSVANTRLVTG